MAEPDPISDDDLRDVSRWLEAALSKTSQEERHELVGRGVRALTRVWATANPDFGDDTWHPVRDHDDQPGTAVDIGAALRNALGRLGASFAANELAYLTVTSKVEGPLRDRLAWAFQIAKGNTMPPYAGKAVTWKLTQYA